MSMLRRENTDKDTAGKNINERKRRVYSEYHPRAFHRPNTQVEEQFIKSGNSCCQVSNTNIVNPLEGSRKSTSETRSQSGNEKRHSYRTKSSGYGTGSSQGSEEVFNNDVFEDIYTASAQVDALNSSISKSENEEGTLRNFHEMGVHDVQFLSEKEGSECSSNSSNVTILDACNLPPGDIPLFSAANRSKSMSSRKVYNPYKDTGHCGESEPCERLLSNQEPSFEIQISATSDGNICANKNPMNDTAPIETTDFNSLFDGNVALLRKYISEQQNSPIYAPSGEDKASILPDEGMHHESQSNTKDETDSSSQERLYSSRASDDCFCSILPSNDIHIPQNEMEKMYISAMRRLNKQVCQQDLQKVLAAIDGEDKTMSIIFQDDQNSEDFISSVRASRESCPSTMDTIDKILHQIRDKDYDLSFGENLMAPQSVDQLQATVAFPDEKFTSPPVSFAIENEGNRELLLQRLYMAALCSDNMCSNVECSMGQELLEHLKERLEQNLTYESSSCQQMLKTIAWHAEVCEEMKCPLPHCNFFQETDIPFSEQIARLQQTFYCYMLEITEQPTKTDKFWKVNSRVPVDKALQEGVDWSVVSRMGYFGQGPYLVQSSIYQPSSLDIQDYWVVKKISLDEEKAGDKAKLLHTICGIGQEHIIPLLWLLYQPSSLFVCSQFEGMSLSDYLKSKEFELGLGRDFTVTYLQQLTKAAGYLHTRNILYLNWTCDHVIIENDRVKLCNLTSAVVYSGIEYDEDMLEDVMMTLPPHVLPPELLALSSIGAYSDIWGLGCIAHEMYRGTRVHNNLRHCDLSSQRNEIRRHPVPNLSKIKDGVLLNILNVTLQIKYEDRPPCCALRSLLDRQISAIR